MEKAKQEFLGFTKKVLAELRSFGATLLGIQERLSSIRDQQDAANQRQMQERQRPPILQEILEIPEPARREKRASDERQYCVQVWLTIGTWLAFVAAAIYAAIAASQLGQMRVATEKAGITADVAQKQLALAERSLGATMDTFHLEQRAWIGVTRFTTSIVERSDTPYIEPAKETRFIGQFEKFWEGSSQDNANQYSLFSFFRWE